MSEAWLTALVGGVLIGLSATLLLWLTGRIAGISGLVGGVVMPQRGDTAWRAAFLLGMVAAGAAYLRWGPEPHVSGSGSAPVLLVVAGLLVGFGARMGNGCTSGHGVCGLGRLAPRSMVAVPVFMLTAVATTYIVRHVA